MMVGEAVSQCVPSKPRVSVEAPC